MLPDKVQDIIAHSLVFLVWLIIVVSLVLTLSEAAPAQEIKVDLDQTRFRVWENNCSSCHGNGSEATQFGLDEGAPKNLFSKVGRIPTKEIIKFITTNDNVHSSISRKLTKKNIEMISRYVRISSLLYILDQRAKQIDRTGKNTDGLQSQTRVRPSLKY